MSFPLHRYRRLRRTEIAPDDGPRDDARAVRLHRAALRRARARASASPSRRCRASTATSPDLAGKDAKALAVARRPLGDPLRDPRPEGRDGHVVGRPRGPGLPGRPGDQGREPEDGRHDRRLPLRVHGPRPLRRHRRARPSTTTRRSRSSRPRRSRTRRRAPTSSRRRDMMDGRVGAIRDGARRERLRGRPDPRLRGEVRVGLLRPVPRGGRVDAVVRRPPRLPDGPRRTCARR